MRDLRKKILLESGKTVSRKARAKPDSSFGSTTTSPASSRPASRAPSRYASDAESDDSDINESLTNSVIDSEDGDTISDWTDKLKACITEILDRKRSSVKGREAYLAGYVHLTRHHFADTIIEGQLHELVPAMLKSIRSGRNTEEVLAGLKALTMSILSTESDSIYDDVYSSLKQVCENSDEGVVKVEAINAMTVATVFGGGMGATMQELMDYLLEIVESDGHNIDAPDNGPVVTAALICWGILATYEEDLMQQSEAALEAFTEQLDSSDVDVQVSAGSNIALIFEVMRAYNERVEEEHDQRQEEARLEAKRLKLDFEYEEYNPFDLQYDQHKIVHRVSELAGESSRAVSKKDRRKLHQQFASILTSIELGKGPKYSKAGRAARQSDRDGDRVYGNEKDVYQEVGYRDMIRDENGRVLSIESWSLGLRVAFLRKILGGGFNTHWRLNPVVEETFDSA
ncbi:hypothetical protein PG996_007340 [Apiospora saccharicola]|uniref:Interferon-related developmental regulator N-terminal domain-containing protein n=1 Tax=Apiospora saccharicola TaxID=335842 RepID=A0ABR1VAM9_9PEZI